MHALTLRQAALRWVAARGRDWHDFWFRPSDPAPLGVLRILVGAMLVYTHLVYGLRLESLFGSSGWHDPDLMAQVQQGMFVPSFWWYVPDAWLWTVHWISIGILVLFLVGLATPVTSVLAFVVTVSYAYRAQLANFGLDQMNALLTLYLAMGPSGAALSLDSWLRRPSTGHVRLKPSSRATLALRLIQVHFCIIYLWAGMSKLQGTAWWNGLAFWLALAHEEYQSFDMTWLAWYPWMLNLLTHVTIFWELSFWNLVYRPNFRVPMLVLGAFLHLGIGAFMGMWTFCWIMIIGYLAFVPDLLSIGLERWRGGIPNRGLAPRG